MNPVNCRNLFVSRLKNTATEREWENRFSNQNLFEQLVKNEVVKFTNILRAAFTHADPKSAKKSVKLSSFLRFWDLWA